MGTMKSMSARQRAQWEGNGDWFAAQVDPEIWERAAAIVFEKGPIAKNILWCDELRGVYRPGKDLHSALHLIPRMLPRQLSRLNIGVDAAGRYCIDYGQTPELPF